MSEQIVFDKLRGSRLSDEVASRIRSEIEAGRLVVGSRLPSERILCEQFGVSRTALREAMRSLENAGLVKKQKGVHGGAIIQGQHGDAVAASLLDMYHLGSIEPRHLTQARIVYESAIIRVAIVEATAADIEELQANVAQSEFPRTSGNIASRIDLYLEFHRILARISRNPIMIAVMNGLLDIMAKFIAKLGPLEDTFMPASRRRFMKHFIARDVEASVKDMEDLLRKLELRYLDRVKSIQN